ncbi:serine hydrolase [Amorphus sp. 3PC139-8]|uniref:serine hydrolase n=1 Tax=Amorphus sp. 3PC139-8 TaxID=2735676 RepID=UPI00345C7D6E
MAGSAAAEDLPPPLAPAAPVPPGRIDMAIGKIDEIVEDVMARSGVPGLAVVVVRDGETAFAKGYGVRKAGEDQPVDTDTVFQLASLSKPISATVVARAVGEGVVDWTTPVVDHLPWFALSDPYVTSHVTVGDLFAHRSGLPEHAGDDLEDLGYDRRQILERLRVLPLASFRDSYAYTNIGLTAAAEAVAVAAGTDWAMLGEDTLFKPLGMASASYRVADYLAHDNRAAGHVDVDGSWQAKYVRKPDAQAPAGGVSASVSDFGKWLAMVMDRGDVDGEEVIASDALLPATQAQMISGAIPDPAARPGLYGFGFGTGVDASGRVVLSHSGAFAMGFATNFQLLPLDKVAIGVLSNASPTGVPESVAHSFIDLVEFGEIRRDWYAAYRPRMLPLSAPAGSLVGKTPPADPAPAPAVDALVGTYQNAYFGPVEIRETDGGLEIALGPKPILYKLTHWDGPMFAYRPITENEPEGSVAALTFSLDGDEPATALTIDYLDENGFGTFDR